MSKVLVCSLAALIVLLMINIHEISAQEKPILVIYKDISHNTFTWSDKVEIKITVSNVGQTSANDVSVVDYIPPGFTVEEKQGLVLEADKVITHIDEIKNEKEFVFSYTLVSEDTIDSKKPITFHLPPAEVSFIGSGEEIRKSNQLSVTVKPNSPWWEENSLGAIALLIAVSFVSGYSGTYIHNKNTEREAGQTQTNQPTTPPQPPAGGGGGGEPSAGETPAEGNNPTGEGRPEAGEGQRPNQNQQGKPNVSYSPLVGGAAGLIILTSFEGLSVLFSNGQMVLNTYNIILLIGTCLAAGFAPMEVIDRATKKWKTEAEQKKTELQATKKESMDELSESKKNQDEADKLMETLKEIIKNT